MYTSREAANVLGISYSLLRLLIVEKKIEYCRFGKNAIRFTEKQINDYLQNTKESGKTEKDLNTGSKISALKTQTTNDFLYVLNIYAAERRKKFGGISLKSAFAEYNLKLFTIIWKKDDDKRSIFYELLRQRGFIKKITGPEASYQFVDDKWGYTASKYRLMFFSKELAFEFFRAVGVPQE